jgi:hypothetical protein
MIHGVRNLPLSGDSSSSSSSSLLRMYAKAAVHLPGHLPLSSSKVKTHAARVVSGSSLPMNLCHCTSLDAGHHQMHRLLCVSWVH